MNAIPNDDGQDSSREEQAQTGQALVVGDVRT